jgi:hypothetical protein
VLARANAALSELVHRDNAETDELRACDAVQSGGAGSTAACGFFWADPIARYAGACGETVFAPRF